MAEDPPYAVYHVFHPPTPDHVFGLKCVGCDVTLHARRRRDLLLMAQELGWTVDRRRETRCPDCRRYWAWSTAEQYLYWMDRHVLGHVARMAGGWHAMGRNQDDSFISLGLWPDRRSAQTVVETETQRQEGRVPQSAHLRPVPYTERTAP